MGGRKEGNNWMKPFKSTSSVKVICLLKSTSLRVGKLISLKRGWKWASLSVGTSFLSPSSSPSPKRTALGEGNSSLQSSYHVQGPSSRSFFYIHPTPWLRCKFYSLHFMEEEPRLWLSTTPNTGPTSTQYPKLMCDGAWIQTHLCWTNIKALTVPSTHRMPSLGLASTHHSASAMTPRAQNRFPTG